MEFFDYCPLEGKKFQFVCRVVGLSLAQAPTGIGHKCLCHPHGSGRDQLPNQTHRHQCGAWTVRWNPHRQEWAWWYKVFSGHQRPVGTCCPTEWQPFSCQHFRLKLTCAGSCYLHKFRDKPMVISCESQKTLDLCDVCLDWPHFDSFYFALISGYSLGRNHVPQVGNLPSE